LSQIGRRRFLGEVTAEQTGLTGRVDAKQLRRPSLLPNGARSLSETTETLHAEFADLPFRALDPQMGLLAQAGAV
jgi:hypothetical protein